MIIAALITVYVRLQMVDEPLREARDDAAAAIEVLQAGDLLALDTHLAAHRGDTDFAYFFTSETTPRALGDALASVAGEPGKSPLRHDIDPHSYDLALTDLAGAVALATHGVDDRALSASWTSDFIDATTSAEKRDGDAKEVSNRRADQDLANKQNLLLLLSRGYWSTEFLESITEAYWQYDKDNGNDAWSQTSREGVRYAPAPTGHYLTDGILALTASLTANPEASAWAFTTFQPGTEQIDGSDHRIGEFTHFLLFEHEFPESADGESLGMTATLTALSSAIDATSASDSEAATSNAPRADTVGPAHDAAVLQLLAKELTHSGCSRNPVDYWHCAVGLAETVWHWIQRWGHLILDILTLATFTPPPFNAIGVAAAASNATWYAIEGDYTNAGLSLAAAVPGLAFAKIAKGVNAGSPGSVAATKTAEVANTAKAWITKPWKDCSTVRKGGITLKYGDHWTAKQRRAADTKVKAYWLRAQAGGLRKTLSARTGSGASEFKKSGGVVPAGKDLDHTIDLQLGGADSASNIQPLDPVVNRSMGKQVGQALKKFELGEPVSSVAIC